MKLVTDYYNLGMSQGSIDYVDVNVDGDVPVYIDPTALRNQSGDWAEGCVVLLQSFFEALLTSIRTRMTIVFETLFTLWWSPTRLIWGVVEVNRAAVASGLRLSLKS